MHSSSTSLIKRSLGIAAPIAAANLVSVLSPFIGVLFLSNLGPKVLAASALMTSMQIFVTVVVSSLLFCVSVIVSNHVGSHNDEAVGETYRQAMFLALCLALPVIIILEYSKTLLLWLGQEPALVTIATPYLHILVFAVVPALWRVVNQQTAFGIMRPRYVLLSSVLGLVTLTFVSYALILGRLGMPALGVRGYGIAVCCQLWVVFIALTLFLKISGNSERFHLFRFKLFKSFRPLQLIFKLGWPIFIHVGSDVTYMVVLVMLIGLLGPVPLASWQIVTQFTLLASVPIFGVAQGSAALVSQARGAGNLHEIRSIALINTLFASAYSFINLLLFILIPNHLINFYLHQSNTHLNAIRELAVTLFLIAGFARIFDGIRNTLSGTLRGLYDTQYTMLNGIIILWLIAMPLGYYLSFNRHLGVLGFALGNIVGLWIGALSIAWRWWRITRFSVLKKA